MPDTSRLRSLAVSDSGFIFDPVTGHTFTVNPTGLAVLQALKEGTPRDHIAKILETQFEPEGGEDIGRDIEEFLSRLREQGLIK